MSRMPLAAVVLALALAACGGGDGDTDAQPSPSASSVSPTPSAMSKTEYVAAANAVCKRVLTEANAVTEPKNGAEFASATEQLLKLVDDGQRDLRALTPPAEDATEVEKFLSENEQQAEVLRTALPKIKAAAEGGDEATAQAEFATAFTQFNEIAGKSEAWAKAYGLTECYSE